MISRTCFLQSVEMRQTTPTVLPNDRQERNQILAVCLRSLGKDPPCLRLKPALPKSFCHKSPAKGSTSNLASHTMRTRAVSDSVIRMMHAALLNVILHAIQIVGSRLPSGVRTVMPHVCTRACLKPNQRTASFYHLTRHFAWRSTASSRRCFEASNA